MNVRCNIVKIWSNMLLASLSACVHLPTRLLAQASRNRQQAVGGLLRCSSTSTILLDESTVSYPDPKSTIRALAHAVCLQIKHRDPHSPGGNLPEIFDERRHPVEVRPPICKRSIALIKSHRLMR